MPDLLIELFSEEIPARMQARAAADLKRLVTEGLVEAGLTYASAGAFSTPRRLALSVEGVLAESPAVREERKGPRTDAPEQALAGFLRSTGLSKDDLEARDDKKGQVWFAVIDKPGRPAGEIIAEVLEATIRDFPWPKSMRWGAGSLRWVRPLHSILCILTHEDGATVVPLDVDGIVSGDATAGHRFMAPKPFSVTSFEDYAARLKKSCVILSAEERAEKIWHDATHLAFAQGLEVVEDKGLLSEVAGLVEWPVVLMGEIGADFLELAGGGAADLDERAPEVLQRARQGGQDRQIHHGRQPRNGGRWRDHSGGQSKGPFGAAGGCQVLLGKRSADRGAGRHGGHGGAAGGGDVPQQAGLSGRADRADRGSRARDRAGGRREARSGGRGGAHREGRSGERDGL